MESSDKRIIVVLGMHRSGTSMVTCGLGALGVALGNRLNPPVKGVNDKGFFEDADILNLNIQMLNALGTDWHYLTPIETSDVDILVAKGFFLQAIEMLKQKMTEFPVWGVKDPRIGKLMLFWHRVFVHCGFDVGYVLAIRNPLSVARSLEKRDGLSHDKSYLSWLEHVITSLLYTSDHPRALVDYDFFIQSPQQNLELIAERLALKINYQVLQVYLYESIDESLRHTLYSENDLNMDPACPPLVQELYSALLKVSRNNRQMDDSDFQTQTMSWVNEFYRFKSSLRWMDALWSQMGVLNQIITASHDQIERLNIAIRERDTRIDNLNQVVSERDGQICCLFQTVADHENDHSQQLLEIQQVYDQDIIKLSSQYVEQEQSYNRQLQINQDELIRLSSQLQETKISQKNELNQLYRELDYMRSAYTWRYTAPLRGISDFLGQKVLGYFNSTPATVETVPTNKTVPSLQTHSITNYGNLDMSTKHSDHAAGTLEELLCYDDDSFIQCAYLTLLGREPDPEGRAYYLARVRSGISKIEILTQLHKSMEGRAREAKLFGLNGAIRRHRLLKTPVLGSLLRFAGVQRTGEDVQQQLRSISNKLHLIEVLTQQLFSEMNETFLRRTQLGKDQESVSIEQKNDVTTNERLKVLDQVRQAILTRSTVEPTCYALGRETNDSQNSGGSSSASDSEITVTNRTKLLRKILWVVNSSDLQTQKYRVFNYSEELALHGIQSKVVNENNLLDLSPKDFDIVVLNRIAASNGSRKLVSTCKKLGIPVVFDIDDLVFDPDRVELLRFVENLNLDQQEQLRNGFELWRETLLSCDAVTTSTFALLKEVRSLNLPAFVLPNTIGRADLDEFTNVDWHTSRIKRTGIRIGYFSGTNTHQEDFAVCVSALDRILGEFTTVELLVVGHLDIPDELQKYGSRIVIHPLMPHTEMLRCLATVDINLVPLELNNAFTDCKSELKIFEAAIFGIPCIASPTSTFLAVVAHGDNGLLAESSEEWYVSLKHLIVDSNDRTRMGQRAKERQMRRFSISTAIQEAKVLFNSLINNYIPQKSMLEAYEPGWQSTNPLVTVIAVLYGKQNEVRYFLESLRRQDFQGPFEVLLVDDMSTDNSVRVVEDFVFQMNKAKQFAARMQVRVLKNSSNLGNCVSRNRAITEAVGKVIIVIDADCMVNSSYVFEHYRAHQHGDCDVAIGPMNIETLDGDPYSVLGCHESDRTLRIRQAELQDPKNPDSFVNCITRNFSISRQFLTTRLSDNLFDERFGYSADPNTGFGWEDVEMGCRLYKAGARIRFLPETFSIHVSHPSTTDESIKAFRSLKNYKRLHETHPDLVLLSRQWGIKTYQAIINWTGASADKLSSNDDYSYLEGTFNRYRHSPITVQNHRPLRILTYRWHCSHQYELYRSGHDFTLATGTGTGLCENWDWDKRPMPRNANFARFDEVNPKDYDLAILHFDENALHPERCNGKVPTDWGATLRSFLDNVNLPKVAICHGTPQFAGQYNAAYTNPDLGAVYEDSRKELVELFHDILVVCNSHQARHEWGFNKSTVVWHGFSPHDYPQGTGDRGVLTMLYAALENRPHYNGLFVFNHVRDRIKGTMEIDVLKVPEPPLSYVHGSREWAESKFLNYSREIGSYSVYLNTTLRSPMPRSRGEAMMAGLVSVSMRNHDVDLFIRNGANGFFADCPDELVDQLIFLKKHHAAREKMAAASRQTALDIFNQDRYLAEWSKIFKQTVG